MPPRTRGWGLSLAVALCFSVWPVLTLAAENIGEVYLREIVLWSAVFASVGLLVWVALVFLMRDWVRPSVIVACASLLLFATPQVVVFGGGLWPPQNTGFPVLLGGVFMGVIAVLCAVLARDAGLARRSMRFVTVLGLALVLVPAFHIGRQVATDVARWAVSTGEGRPVEEPGALGEPSGAATNSSRPLDEDAQQRPDIYFIVLDRYGSQPVLERYFAFDNREFLDQLRARGFYVADASLANYLKTAHSLAATLNLGYLSLDSLGVDRDSRSYLPLYDKISDNALLRTLRSQGYRYYHFGSWWRGTSRAAAADFDFMRKDYGGSFRGALMRASLLIPQPQKARRAAHRARILSKFERLAEVRDDPAPTFAFAHFLVPHDPFVFDAEGAPVSLEEQRARPWRDGYVSQLQFLNGLLLQLVDALLENPGTWPGNPEAPPVVIFQSDEGPFLRHPNHEMGYVDWRHVPPDSLLHKFGILNALRLPGVDSAALWQEMTPVNTIRLVLNAYFGMDFERLPDRSYVFPVDAREEGPATRLYDFTDVTEALRAALDEP